MSCPFDTQGRPASSVDPENCTHTESFAYEFWSAFNRIQSLYLYVGSGVDQILTEPAGFEDGTSTLAAPR